MPMDEYFHSFHVDLKALAYGTGTDGGNASFPCAYCERKITIDVPFEQQFKAGKLRSCNSNRRHYKRYLKSGDATAKKHASCSSNPLREFP